MNAEMLASVSERRRSDPLTCLLMWLLALNADPVREALRLLEVSIDEIYNMFSGLEYEQAQMRRLRMVCELTGREQLGKLMRGRLTELLMQCTKATDIAALLKAGVLLPDWVLDERPSVVNVWDDQGRPFERPDVEGRAAARAFAAAGYDVGAAGNGSSDGTGAMDSEAAESAACDAEHNGAADKADAGTTSVAGLAPLSPAEQAVLAGALGDFAAQQAISSTAKSKRSNPKLPRRR